MYPAAHTGSDPDAGGGRALASSKDQVLLPPSQTCAEVCFRCDSKSCPVDNEEEPSQVCTQRRVSTVGSNQCQVPTNAFFKLSCEKCPALFQMKYDQVDYHTMNVNTNA